MLGSRVFQSFIILSQTAVKWENIVKFNLEKAAKGDPFHIPTAERLEHPRMIDYRGYSPGKQHAKQYACKHTAHFT